MDLTYQSTTTLARIRAASPCKDVWEKLLAHLGKTKADDEPLSLLTVLDSNGLDDALWVLSFAMPDNRLARHFQAWCAEQVLHLFEAECPDDMRLRDHIAMLRNDAADDKDQATARAAALDAARAAARAAELDAALYAALDAARYVALVAWAAAGDGARDAAWAAQEKQLRKMIGGV